MRFPDQFAHFGTPIAVKLAINCDKKKLHAQRRTRDTKVSRPGYRPLVSGTVLLLACLGLVAGAAYGARRTLLIDVARVFLSHEFWVGGTRASRCCCHYFSDAITCVDRADEE